MIRNRPVRGISPLMIAVGMGLLLLIVVFVAGCGGDEASEPPAEETTRQEEAEQATASEETEPEDDSVASVGETVSVGDVQWTVTDAQQYDELISDFGNDQGNFIIVNLTFSNNTNQDITFATPFMTLVDSEGREFEPDIDINFRQIKPENNMFVNQVAPGSTKEGRVIFPVTPDASGLRLQVGGARFASEETVYIDLGI